MTPMIDVVFLLLIFFLLTSRFVEPHALGVELPKSTTATAQAGKPVVVVLRGDGNVLVGGRRVARSELVEAVENALSASGRPSARLEADASASVQELVEVLDALRSAGATDVALAAGLQRGRGPY